MASISLLNTLIASGYTLPEWVGYVIFVFLLFTAFFALPPIIRLLVGQTDK